MTAAELTSTRPACIGLIVHPSRPLDNPLGAVRQWAQSRDVELVQVPTPAPQQRVAEPAQASDCDLIVSLGGDGTMLAALRAGSVAHRPVLGVACGSLGVLISVDADAAARALDRFRDGDWVPRSLPALDIHRDAGDELFALNDVAVVRSGEGQVRVSVQVDGVLFAETVGDGWIVSTPIGSSAYALAAGGPLLAAEARAFLLTPLPTHGGVCPPLVVDASSQLQLDADPGHGGARLELDGQVEGPHAGRLRIGLRGDAATVVSFPDEEPLLTGLRRRRIIRDSPRIVAELAGD